MRPAWSVRWIHLAATLALLASCTGCPELNRQPDRSGGQYFSVDDPTGRYGSETIGAAGIDDPANRPTIPEFGPTQVVHSEEGGLPDQSRRAH